MDHQVADEAGRGRLFEGVIDTFPGHVAILDAEGAIRATNRAWREYGAANGIQTSPDTVGMNYLAVTEAADDDSADRAAAGLRAVLGGERERFEFEYPCHAPDERRWFIMRATAFVRDGERYVAVVHTDITDRKEQELQLRATSEMLRFVQETMASSRPLADKMKSLLEYGRTYMNVEQGFFTRVDDGTQVIRVAAGPNEQLQRGASVSIRESYCRHTIDPATEHPLVVEHASAEGWDGDPAFARFGLECYVGATVFVDGDPYGTICFADRRPADGTFSEQQRAFVELITEWASYELEQRRHERQYRRLTERISDAYYACDADWTVTYCNDTFAARLGVPVEEIVGTTLWEVYPKVAGTAYEETLRDAMATQRQQSCECYHEPDDYWLDVTAYPDEDGISVLSTDITERKERQLELELSETVFQNTQDAIFLVDVTAGAEFRIKRVNQAYEALTGLSAGEIRGKPLREVADDEYVADIEARFRECIERREPLEYVEQLPVPEEQSYWHTKIAPVVDDGTVVELVGATRDITERKKREQELRARRDELAQLHRLNTLVREIIQALQDTNTQDCIESAVCDRLTTSELYQAVWIGAPDWSRPAEVAIVPQTTAGLDEETLAELTAVDDPTLRALHTGEIQVVDDLAAADRLSETHRQALREHGCHALAAVPLSGENTSYGVLVVYLSDSHTISDAERDVLTDLGEILALAIQRVHSQRSLAGEAAVELEFRLPDADIAFGEVSATLDCELALERLVPTSDGAALAYHTVRGTEPGRMSEALAAMEGIGGCTVVREAEDGQSGLIETHLTDTSLFPATVLTEYGASVASARAVDGDVSFSAELAPEIDVRAVLDTIHETLPDVELTSKQLVDRSATTTPGVQQQLGDRLTPKQQATLEVAYSRGYYSWPRETTAQELADALDISAPTLHYRLRRAHQTVLQTLLESDAHDR